MGYLGLVGAKFKELWKKNHRNSEVLKRTPMPALCQPSRQQGLWRQKKLMGVHQILLSIIDYIGSCRELTRQQVEIQVVLLARGNRLMNCTRTGNREIPVLSLRP
jgi:hypothetical protein